MSVSVFNRCWSKVILETLVRQGVTHFCIAPGSRSTPLTLEAVRLQNANRALCHTHFDERGLGFFALGIPKNPLPLLSLPARLPPIYIRQSLRPVKVTSI